MRKGPESAYDKWNISVVLCETDVKGVFGPISGLLFDRTNGEVMSFLSIFKLNITIIFELPVQSLPITNKVVCSDPY